MKRGWLLFLPLFCLGNVFPGAVAGYKVETIGGCTNAEVSEAVKSALNPEGFRITGGSGILCEVWLRKVIPQKAGSTGAAYNTIANGAFVGVITYPSKAGDYRGQGIKPGTYTLRYHAIPQDGNHAGAAPQPDFFLLLPASADKNPNALIEFQEAANLSKQASGTNHPAPLSLTPTTGGGALAFREANESDSALETKTKAKPAGEGAEVDFPLALILIGKAE
jgi:hypothetical protein